MARVEQRNWPVATPGKRDAGAHGFNGRQIDDQRGAAARPAAATGSSAPPNPASVAGGVTVSGHCAKSAGLAQSHHSTPSGAHASNNSSLVIVAVLNREEREAGIRHCKSTKGFLKENVFAVMPLCVQFFASFVVSPLSAPPRHVHARQSAAVRPCARTRPRPGRSRCRRRRPGNTSRAPTVHRRRGEPPLRDPMRRMTPDIARDRCHVLRRSDTGDRHILSHAPKRRLQHPVVTALPSHVPRVARLWQKRAPGRQLRAQRDPT